MQIPKMIRNTTNKPAIPVAIIHLCFEVSEYPFTTYFFLAELMVTKKKMKRTRMIIKAIINPT
jgi:hypothetical protein